jgi:hypothetical protein
MAGTKSEFALTFDQIAHAFNDACIENLARIGKLPSHANRQRFADGLREAARNYATEIRQPNDNEVRAEIEKLYRAAERKHYSEVAARVQKLSSGARSLLKYGEWTRILLAPKPGALRGRRPTSSRWTNIEVPSPEALLDERRDQACATVVKLCQYGGRWVEGRKRPSGKRSLTWRPYFRAPERQRQFPKREEEQDFIIRLRLAWLEATGEEATLTSDPRRPGPFARMVKQCLSLVGAGHADADGLLNKLNQIRREMNRRSAIPPLSANNS